MSSKADYDRRIAALNKGGAEADAAVQEIMRLPVFERVNYLYPHQILWPHELAQDID